MQLNLRHFSTKISRYRPHSYFPQARQDIRYCYVTEDSYDVTLITSLYILQQYLEVCITTGC